MPKTFARLRRYLVSGLLFTDRNLKAVGPFGGSLVPIVGSRPETPRDREAAPMGQLDR
jgi:hypothetical protein